MQDAIEKELGEMRQESAGKRDSHMAGKGSIYSHLQGELQGLKSDQQRIDEEIRVVDTQIEAARNDTAEETAVEAGYKRELSASEQSDTGTLTAPERDERDRLEVEVAGYKSAVAAAQRQKEQVEGDLAGLPQKFALSTRNDSLAQTQALYEILTQNWFLRVKVAAIFMLLFLIDVTPVLVKLTVRTGYDEYRKSRARVDFMAAAADREAFHKLAMESSALRTERLTDFGASSAEQLRRLESGPSDSPYVRSVLGQVGRAIGQYTGDTIREADSARKPEKQFNLLNLVSPALMTIRGAFGTGLGMWRQVFRR
jgi:Domain of unknown function (DUF4407)